MTTQIDEETQGFRISGMQQGRLAAMLGQMLLTGIVNRTKGAAAHPLIDLDVHEVCWPSPGEDDLWLQMLSACIPGDLTDPNLHRLSIEKVSQEILKLMFPASTPVPVMPRGWPGPRR